MARSLPALLKPKAPTHASKKFKAMSDSKKLTTIEDLLRKQKARSSANKRGDVFRMVDEPATRRFSGSNVNKLKRPRSNLHQQQDDSEDETELHWKPSHSRVVAARQNVDEMDTSSKDTDDENENEQDGDEESWLDGSTLVAQYENAEISETEEERALALVEYLRVPMQEKSQELKRDLRNALLSTLTEIRQAHLQIDAGPDVERAKGIIHFNDACDKRHVDVSRVQAELQETERQIEIKKLFAQLKQAHDGRSQLWVKFKAKIAELTSHQAELFNDVDDNMARTVSNLEKKFNAMLKESSARDKEKLLRGVLGRLE